MLIAKSGVKNEVISQFKGHERGSACSNFWCEWKLNNAWWEREKIERKMSLERSEAARALHKLCLPNTQNLAALFKKVENGEEVTTPSEYQNGHRVRPLRVAFSKRQFGDAKYWFLVWLEAGKGGSFAIIVEDIGMMIFLNIFVLIISGVIFSLLSIVIVPWNKIAVSIGESLPPIQKCWGNWEVCQTQVTVLKLAFERRTLRRRLFWCLGFVVISKFCTQK